MIKVTSESIPIEETINSLRSPECGAVMSYLGTVRNYLDDKQSKGLSFEVNDDEMRHSLEELESEAIRDFDIRDVAIVHRTGSFAVGDNILLISISAGHRGPAFDACQYIVDRTKDFHEKWKREELAD